MTKELAPGVMSKAEQRGFEWGVKAAEEVALAHSRGCNADVDWTVSAIARGIHDLLPKPLPLIAPEPGKDCQPKDRGHCLGCGHKLRWMDDDPNGAHNATCARCRAEEEHDFDADPHAVFNRNGDRIGPQGV